METNSFHLSIRKMTIILDDVYRAPADCRLIFYVPYIRCVLVEAIRVEREDASIETRHYRGGHVRLSWLRNI